MKWGAANLGDRKYEGSETLELLEGATNYNRFIADLIREVAGKNSVVLDFGAGNGTLASMVAPYVRELDALEPDRLLRSRIEANFQIRTVPSFESLSRKYSVIYLINVLEHIEDDIAILRELTNHLETNGRILIYVPASPLLYSEFDRSIGHFRRYSLQSLRVALEAAGLHLQEIRYLDPVGWLVALAHKVLRLGPKITPGQVRFFDRLLFPISRRLSKVFGRFFGKNLVSVATLTSRA